MSAEPTPSGPKHVRAGWSSSFRVFRAAEPSAVLAALKAFVDDANHGQIRAWNESIPLLQREVEGVVDAREDAQEYSSILEYELPLEARRSDAVFLVAGAVVVIELKGKDRATQADLDQAAAYARDLRAYHRECQDRPVHAVLVPTRAPPALNERDGVWISSPALLNGLVQQLVAGCTAPPPDLQSFLDADAYRPLPTLVQAARELFHSSEVREVWRARAATEPALRAISSIAHEAALTRTRHLVLVTGVPGSGKTLVGMRAVHAHFLDDLAVERDGRRPGVPALYLSGNGPLVQVLQHALRSAGGGGRTFVRHIKAYLDTYVSRPERRPPEHLLVFDEAQRAFTAEKVGQLHTSWPAELVHSEPDLFVRLCNRMPQWSVLIGLVGTGQEIHTGEEGGLSQWRAALESSPERWVVHAPELLERAFDGSGLETRWSAALNLNTTLRFHLASDLHALIARILDGSGAAQGASLAAEREWPPSEREGLRLWATRDLDTAKGYLRERYASQPSARFGLLASSRDRLLVRCGVDNSWQATKRTKLGPWYSDGDDSPLSCRRLDACVTEFGAQGLELDMALLCWGSDLVRLGGTWSIRNARAYKRGRDQVAPVDPFRLRLNAYRVLLTRGRDGTVVFVPPDKDLDETWEHLLAHGFRELEAEVSASSVGWDGG